MANKIRHDPFGGTSQLMQEQEIGSRGLLWSLVCPPCNEDLGSFVPSLLCGEERANVLVLSLAL